MAVRHLGSIIDTHIHLWDPLTTPREASAGARAYKVAPKLVTALFPLVIPKQNRVYIMTPRWVASPFLPRDYAQVARCDDDDPDVAFTVAGYVHVEASWLAEGFGSVDETRWIADVTAHTDPPLTAIVAHIDPRWDRTPDILDAHMEASADVVGVRCSAAHSDRRGVKSWIDDPHLYSSPAFLSGFAAVADRNLTFDAWVYSDQLPDVAVLAREYPDTTIILDHYGTPVGMVGEVAGYAASPRTLAKWRDDLADLAQLPNVVVKHSGVGMPILGHGRNVSRGEFIDVMTPHIAYIAELFGPQRGMFGSNTPMDLPCVTYSTLVAAVATGVSEALGDDGLPEVFQHNARRIYGRRPR